MKLLPKVIKKNICNQLEDYIGKFRILHVNQSEFRAGYSCGTTLLDLTDNILRELDAGKNSALILLDYSRAFETISYDIMSALLHFVGCSYDAIGLLFSYFNGKCQYIHRGVPQGSSLTVNQPP